MSEDQFTKLFKYMQEGFYRLEAKVDSRASQESLDRLTNTTTASIKG